MNRYIILDRDGVINQDSDQFIKNPDEWQPIPGSLEAMAQLKQAGYRIGIATNQSGIARGLLNGRDLNAIHQKMQQKLLKLGGGVDLIAFCPHGPDEACACRKPKPGLYQSLAKRWRIDLTGIPVIGDSLRDLQAAQTVNAQPILVLTGKGKKTLAKLGKHNKIPVYPDLSRAVDALL